MKSLAGQFMKPVTRPAARSAAASNDKPFDRRTTMTAPLDILVVAQTPPPVHGQAVMTQYLLDGRYTRIRLHYVRMAFSDSIDEVGAFKWRKLGHLAATILRVAWARVTTGARVLYYPPAGPKRNAFYRDAALLVATRWMFRKTVFHFYAGGICDLRGQLPSWARVFYRLAYHSHDLGLALYDDGLRDPRALEAKRALVIPCATPDEARDIPPPADGHEASGEPPPATRLVTFLAMLSEEKGVLVFLDACAEVRRRGRDLKPVLVGWPESTEFERRLSRRIDELGLTGVVERHGKTVGREKHAIYQRTHVFCYPSFYPSEGSPVVLLEAMQFGLPVVATRWRGCADSVADGVTGFLVEPCDAGAVAAKLELLLADEPLRRRMAVAARRRYERQFTIEAFRSRIEDALAGLAD